MKWKTHQHSCFSHGLGSSPPCISGHYWPPCARTLSVSHMFTYILSHTYTLWHIHIRLLTPTHSYTLTHSLNTLSYTYSDTFTSTYLLIPTHSYTLTYTPTHTPTYSFPHSNIYTLSDTHTHTENSFDKHRKGEMEGTLLCMFCLFRNWQTLVNHQGLERKSQPESQFISRTWSI